MGRKFSLSRSVIRGCYAERDAVRPSAFAFTCTFHYLFPQLTIGLAPLLLYWMQHPVWGKVQL